MTARRRGFAVLRRTPRATDPDGSPKYTLFPPANPSVASLSTTVGARGHQAVGHGAGHQLGTGIGVAHLGAGEQPEAGRRH